MNGAVLGLYNFREMAGHIGDNLLFHGILEIIRVVGGSNRIDLVCVDDPSNPLMPVHTDFFNSNPRAKEMIYEQWKVLPSVGKIIRLDSDAEFTDYFQSHAKNYESHWPRFPLDKTWPSPSIDRLDFSPSGLTYHHTHQPLWYCYDTLGYLPKLSCPEYILDEMRCFMKDKAGGRKPIVIQVRVRNDDRDGNLDAWKSLLEHVSSDEGYCVFVTCLQGEQERFRDVPGLVFTKDYLSGFLHDLACMQLSWMVLFQNGGLVPWVWFTGIPSIVFGKTRNSLHFIETSGLKDDEKTFPFAPMCHHHWGPYNGDYLIRVFQDFESNLGYENPFWDN